MGTCSLIIGIVIDFCILLVAVIAALISYREYQSHKTKEYSELLSQLNERYLGNDSMQAVVRYLRVVDPEGDEPSAYQVELFLRFFEELYVYMRHDGLKPDDVRKFFNYYLERLYFSERGKKLLEKIKHEDEKLEYLNGYKKIIGFH